MSTPSITSSERAERDARRPGLAETNRARLAWLALACGALMLALLASIAIGSRNIPLGTVLDALFAYDDSDDHAIIRALRLPRTGPSALSRSPPRNWRAASPVRPASPCCPPPPWGRCC